jgi:hypothetical protein
MSEMIWFKKPLSLDLLARAPSMVAPAVSTPFLIPSGDSPALEAIDRIRSGEIEFLIESSKEPMF